MIGKGEVSFYLREKYYYVYFFLIDNFCIFDKEIGFDIK